jgi:hypothetical protein
MSDRAKLAALLANEQVSLPQNVMERIDVLCELLKDRLAGENPAQEGFIAIGMDWSVLELGTVYALPAGEWRGGNQLYFQDAEKFMRDRKGQFQFEFGGNKNDGHWVKRIR